MVALHVAVAVEQILETWEVAELEEAHTDLLSGQLQHFVPEDCSR
jgi:hypothetical protein